MSDTNFQPIFTYLDEMKAELKADIAQVDKKVNILQTSVIISPK